MKNFTFHHMDHKMELFNFKRSENVQRAPKKGSVQSLHAQYAQNVQGSVQCTEQYAQTVQSCAVHQLVHCTIYGKMCRG